MGCFLACFGTSEVEKSRKRSKRVQPRDRRYHVSKPVLQGSSSSGNASENPPVSETWDKPEEQLSLSKRKKVTFDAIVKVYEPVLPHEEADLLLESENGQKQENNLAKYSNPIQPKPSPVDNHVPSSFGTYPPNHRYQSCNDSNEEDEVLDYADSDLDQIDDDDTDDEGVGEEDDELSEDEGEEWKRGTSKMELCTEEIDDSSSIWTRELAEKESGTMEKNRPVRDRSTYVHPVLNPVENLSQWKAVKARGALNVKPQKENSSGFKEEVSFNLKSKTDQSSKFQQQMAVDASLENSSGFKEVSFNLKSKTDQSSKFQQQMAVDASLSNWLISSETRR